MLLLVEYPGLQLLLFIDELFDALNRSQVLIERKELLERGLWLRFGHRQRVVPLTTFFNDCILLSSISLFFRSLFLEDVRLELFVGGFAGEVLLITIEV